MTCMYVSEIFAEEIFVSFPWWLKNVKSRSKIAQFSNERHFKISFPKKKKNCIFRKRYLNYTHTHTHTPTHKKTQFCMHTHTQKDTILHVKITFSLKQGQTRTSSGPIWVPLITKRREKCMEHYRRREFKSLLSQERGIVNRLFWKFWLVSSFGRRIRALRLRDDSIVNLVRKIRHYNNQDIFLLQIRIKVDARPQHACTAVCLLSCVLYQICQWCNA